MSAEKDRAVVLFAHGSRDPLWHRPMEAVAARIRQTHPQLTVRCAYLELSAPDLETVCAELAAEGITQLSITPMFLGVGKHAREDLPALVERMRDQYPGMQFTLQAPVSEDARLVALLAQMAAGE